MAFKITAEEKALILKRRKATAGSYPLAEGKFKKAIKSFEVLLTDLESARKICLTMGQRGMDMGITAMDMDSVMEQVEDASSAFEQLYDENLA